MKSKISIFIKNFKRSCLSSSSHNSRGNSADKYLYAIPLVIFAVVIIYVCISQVIQKNEISPVTEELYNQYSNENSFKDRVYGENQTPNMENTETPENEEFAISVYGDSYCISDNLQVPSFPAYLSKYTNMSLVYNVAASNDSIEMVAARQGGVPMYVSPCDIVSNKKKIEITLENEYGTNLIPDFSKNAGLNPCKINNIEGVISTDDSGKLYFTRNESGYENIVATPTTVSTRAMDMRLNDITIFFVGSDTIYKNKDRLVDIYTKMVNNLKTDKYLIIGPVAGTSEEINNGNEVLANTFGNKYINLLEYLNGDAITEYNIELSDDEKNAITEKNTLPSVYIDVHNKNYFSDTANDIIGKKIADKLKSLNYIN